MSSMIAVGYIIGVLAMAAVAIPKATATVDSGPYIVPPAPPYVVSVCPPHYVPIFDPISHRVSACVPIPKSQW